MTITYKMKHLFISAVPHTSVLCPTEIVPSSLNLPCFSIPSSCGKLLVVSTMNVASVRSCQKLLLCLTQGVIGGADSKTDSVPGPRAETPLQVLVLTMVRQTVPLLSMQVHRSRYLPWTHVGVVCSRRTASSGRDPLWRSSWRNTVLRRIHTGEVCAELSSELSAWWDPTPEQGKSMRRKEWQRQNFTNRP